MQKLKRSVLDKMIAAQLSSLQVDMMLYLSRYQDDSGYIRGVYYKTASDAIGMTKQSFYDVCRSLQDKGLIVLSKADRSDWDILIVGNDFTGFDYKSGEQYINTNQQIFFSPEFASLKAGSKLLAMIFLRRCAENNGAFRMLKKNFWELFAKVMQVSQRTLHSYVEQLQQFFSFGTGSSSRQDDHIIHIRPRAAAVSKSPVSEQARLHQYNVITACRRSKMEYDDNNLADTAALLQQYRKDIRAFEEGRRCRFNILDILRLASGYTDTGILNAKLIHKLLRGFLGLAPMPPGQLVTE